MKRAVLLLVIMGSLAAALLPIACQESPGVSSTLCYGYFSFPIIYLVNDGSTNIANTLDPVTGSDIKDATVTVTNVTTGVSTTAAYVPAASPSPHGYYTTASNFSHATGQQISVSITSGSKTISGSATKTPAQPYSNLSPSSGAVSRPFTVSWTASSTIEAASHTWLTLRHTTDMTKSYRVVVPISSTSVQMTSSEIPAGSYTISVFGVNAMSITGAKSGSVIYVGSTAPGTTSSVVTVN